MTEKKTNSNKKSQAVSIRFDHCLVEEIKKNKVESEDFSSWVKQACKDRLKLENNVDIDLIMKENEEYKKRMKNEQIKFIESMLSGIHPKLKK